MRFLIFSILFVGIGLLAREAGGSNQRTRRQACNCKPLSACSGRYSTLSKFGRNKCELEGGKSGVCCSDLKKPGTKPSSISLRSDDSLRRPSDISDDQVRRKLNERREATPNEDTDDKSTQAHRLFGASRREDKDISEAANRLLALQDLGISLRAGSDEDGFDARNSQDVQDACPWTGSRKPRCNFSGEREYRTADGSCNNKEQPLWGMQGTPFQRIATPAYADGHQPRLSARGTELPNARLITTNIFQKGDPPNQNDISELFIQFGQFLDHDLTHTPGPNPHINCCEGRKLWGFPKKKLHRDCFPIRIPRNDSFWGPKGRECMEFTRNAISPTLNCRAGAREQQNALTHWIDLSSIYGSTEKEDRLLRGSDRRLLAFSTSNSGEVLPPACPLGRGGPKIEACEEVCKEQQRKCLFSGDFRINEQVGLTIEHTVWIREHNRIAKELSEINPQWGDERVFQEARRINIAEFQHIIYNEWAPLALGTEYMKTIDLFPLSEGSGYKLDYDRNLDPRITNEFAGAAFRFGHSMIKSALAQTNNFGRSLRAVDLRSTFNRPNMIQGQNFLEDTLRGATRSPAAARDGTFSEEVINHLFQDESVDPGGLDLMSFNIQRGRERGIPGYNRYRKVCSSGRFKEARTIDDLVSDGYIKPDALRRLKSIYDHVDDIDLFVGAMLETKHRDSVLGPTFKCIVGDQFQRLKRGDRFWYENPGEFTLAQLNEIRKSSQARVMCNNFKLTQMQPMAFRTNIGLNSLVDCSDTISIPQMNLEVFRE